MFFLDLFEIKDCIYYLIKHLVVSLNLVFFPMDRMNGLAASDGKTIHCIVIRSLSLICVAPEGGHFLNSNVALLS